MNTRNLAEKLSLAHGPAALPMVTVRETFYLHAIQKAEASRNFVNMARLMARRILWGAVAHHLRDLETANPETVRPDVLVIASF